MATAKKAAPAAKKAAKAEDDLLAPKAKGKAAKAEDDLLAPKGKAKAKPAEDDLLAPKGGKGKPKAEAKPKPKAKKTPEFEGSAEDVRAVLLKTRKATSYTDLADQHNFNIRMVRRQARALRDSGEVEITKEGTLGYVRAVKKAA